MTQTWKNADGLVVMFGPDQGRERGRGGEVNSTGATKELVIPLIATDLVGFDADANNDGTMDSFSGMQASIPAGSMIQSATIVGNTAWAAPGTAGASVLTIGLYKMDGTAIDADGIDADILESELAATDVVTCNGALVGAQIGDAAGFVKATATSGNVATAGKSKLILRYTTNKA